MALIRPNNRALQNITTLPSGVSSDYLASDADIGKVLQVVQDFETSGSNSTSLGTWVDSGTFASITPSSTSSKILIIANFGFSVRHSSGTGPYGYTRCYRNTASTIIGGSNIKYIDAAGVSNNENHSMQSFIFLDSPSTTSSTLYKMQYQIVGGTHAYWNYGSDSTITLLEIAG